MDQERRTIPRGDHIAAGIILTVGVIVCIAATILAAPWALANGWQSQRFVDFLVAATAALGLGWAAVGQVISRL
jgi:hypothetical protein